MKRGAASDQEAAGSRSRLDAAGLRLMAYLRRLSLSEPQRLQTALTSLGTVPAQIGDEQEAARLAMADLLAELETPAPTPGLSPTPPLRRTSMVPEKVRPRAWRRAMDRIIGKDRPEPAQAEPAPPEAGRLASWGKVAGRRRLLLSLLIFMPTALAVLRMATVLPHGGATVLEKILLVVFAALFAWISIGFWTAMAGFFTLVRRHDRFAITRADPSDTVARSDVRTAIVFPVYGEDMDRVTAGIEAVYRSLEREADLGRYDFFILSDTRDPEAWVEEEAAWADLMDRVGGRDRIFYRRRRKNTKMKSGNIADFCRRFGAHYVYMLVMDADSIMAGRTIARMVAVMEAKRHIGILQSATVLVGHDTWLARTQKFASHLYGPMFAAGLHFWLLGDAQFWGHNALIRIQPFMRHCALPRLSGRPPLGGEISSHDFVESALMRRAGWGVWLAYDLAGTYEEAPPNLLAELARDRRWCKGNMQHVRLLFSRGFIPVHRALFVNGIMAYGSALLWFLFLAISTAEAVIETLTPPTYFPPTRTLFPQWPIWEPWWALSILATTGVLLFVPKFVAAALAVIQGRARLFGGVWRLVAGIGVEVVTSSLLAPVRMLFHSKFVFITLLGRETRWVSQDRDAAATPWSEAVRFHLGGTVLAALWGAGLYGINRDFFWWICPVLIPLLLSIPLSVVTSLPGLGAWLKSLGIHRIPEETEPPRELEETAALQRLRQDAPRPLDMPSRHGFALAVVDPTTCCRRLGLIRRRACRQPDPAARQALVDKGQRQGPSGLSREEKATLLDDPEALATLHRAVWLLDAGTMLRQWSARLR